MNANERERKETELPRKGAKGMNRESFSKFAEKCEKCEKSQGFFKDFEVRNVRRPVTFPGFLRFLTF